MSVSRSGLYHGSVATSEVGHSHDVPREDDQETGARGRPDPADLERPSGRRAEGALVIAQAELGLCDAYRKTVEAGVLEPLEVVQRGGIVLHVVGAIDRRRDFRDLLLQGILVL